MLKNNQHDEPIEKILEELRQDDPYTPEYEKSAAQLERLIKLRNESRSRIDPNMLVLVGGNFVITIAVIAYEQKHVWTSKFQNFLIRR